MLLDGLAATSCGALPSPEELLSWDAPGALCQAAARRAAAAAAAASQAGVDAQFEEDLLQQAQEDWEAEFDAAEAAAAEGAVHDEAHGADGAA